MKEKKIFYLITLLSMILLCNVSVVQADSNAPTECRISINNNALYTNSRYVTLDLYGVDHDAMQVWISNDGVTGTVIDFAYDKTYIITNQNYSIGTELDSSNSTSTTNSDNVLRIQNWPLSSVNGTKRVYVVFRDAYGNKTSVTGLTTIEIKFNLNGLTSSSGTPATIKTVKNLAVYLPHVVPSNVNKTFTGWSEYSDGSLPNYSSNSLKAFENNTTLYAVAKTINPGEYLYYDVDTSKAVYSPARTITGVSTAQPFDISKYAGRKYIVLSATASKIVICPTSSAQLFPLKLKGETAYNNGKTAINNIASMYDTDYSSSAAPITRNQIDTAKNIDGLSGLVSNPIWITSYWGTYEPDANTYGGTNGAATYCSGGLEIHPMMTNWNSDGKYDGVTYQYPVMPAITLETNVKFSGLGTPESPYTISK